MIAALVKDENEEMCTIEYFTIEQLGIILIFPIRY